jgi:hypothetical protein
MESINIHVRNLHIMGIIIKNGKGIPDFRDLSASLLLVDQIWPCHEGFE